MSLVVPLIGTGISVGIYILNNMLSRFHDVIGRLNELDLIPPFLLIKHNNRNFSLKIPEGKYNEIDIPLRTDDDLAGLAYKACQVSFKGKKTLKICNLGDSLRRF